MTKDEARSSVMGAISMALKDSTLQQGFEIICKNLLELEKENAELKEVHESDKRSLALIAEKGAELEKKLKHAEEHCINKTCVVLKDKEYCVAQLFELEKELENERKINEEIKVRFVKCSSCTEEMKDKCLMFSENLCEGERCEELVDLVALVNQSELQNKCSELEKENSKHKEMIEDMKADMCSTKNKVLCDYLIGILKKYGEIV